MIKLNTVISGAYPDAIEPGSSLYVEEDLIGVIEEMFGEFDSKRIRYSKILLKLEKTPSYKVYESPEEIDEKIKKAKESK